MTASLHPTLNLPLHLLAADILHEMVFNRRKSLKELLLPLFIQVGQSEALRADSIGMFHHGDRRYWLPRFVFRGPETGDPPIKVGLFAGIHGDEPAGILALIDLLQELELDPSLLRAYQLWIYPVCNPTGYEDGTRHSRSELDLNRQFWRGSEAPEIALLESELRSRQLHGIISLHSDDTSEGLYGFVRGATLTEQLMKPALAAAEKALPRNQREQIDGFHAVEGIIRAGYGGVLSAPPEATPAPFEIVLETPASAPLNLQRRSFVLAIKEILREYRRIVAFAVDI
jgi:protein MpaA